MTEVDVDSANQDGSQDTVRAGQLLRQAREQQQLSLQAVAATLKVPVYKLQALEEDRWDVLADSVFTRALALSVCRLLRIPSEPVLTGLPKHEATKLATNPEGINTPFKEKTLRSLMSSQDSGSGNGVKVVAALLIAIAGAAGLYFLPQWETHEGADSAAAVAEVVVEEPVFMPAPSMETALPQSEAASAPAVEGPVVEGASTVVAGEAAPAAQPPAPVTAAPVVPVMEPALPEVGQPAATANGSVLRFSATGDSWVQVRDEQGRVLMEKILKAGDVYQETLNSRPLQVVVGNAGATTLEVNGAAWDLQASARNNVARFEVK